MLVSLNWLKQLTDIKLPQDELLAKIGAQLAEIESVTNLGDKYKGVVVAEIVEADDHPDADRLGVYKVNTGRVTVQVVAGDKSLRPGDKVAYIAPGVVVPATAADPKPVMMTKANLRGKESNGMMGSGKELLFNHDSSKVQKLDAHLKPGTRLVDAYELNDTIIEIENKTLTHRPDGFGLIGTARELAGIQGIPFKSPAWYTKAASLVRLEHEQLPISIKNHVPELCQRYMAVSMSAVKVMPSPLLMQSYLARVGVRPVNNVVDVTNYLMVLTGQPLHAFDYDKVMTGESDRTAQINIRFPKDGEELQLIDGRTIKPHPKAVVIAGRSRILALGGVMGGLDSEVDDHTQRIILESANFNLYNIRETSMKHGIFTDAVTRFARGQDPEQTEPVLHRAVMEISQLAEGHLASLVHDSYQARKAKTPITVNADFINERLGSDFSVEDMVKVLKDVELGVKRQGKQLTVQPPYWRQDLHIAEDVVEEVGRLLGYDKLEVRLPGRSVAPVKANADIVLKQQLRQLLAASGANEVLTYNFVPDEQFDKTSQDRALAFRIRNSLSPELAYMRTSLLPSLFEKVYGNIRAGYDQFALFELNKTHNKQELGKDKLPIERQNLGLVFAAQEAFAKKNLKGAAYFQAKLYLDTMLQKLGVTNAVIEPVSERAPLWIKNSAKALHADRQAQVKVGTTYLGVIGEPSASVNAGYKLGYAAALELDVVELLSVVPAHVSYSPLSRFPAVEQDLTLRVPLKHSYGQIAHKLQAELNQPELIIKTEPVSLYQGEFEKQTRNISWRLTIQHRERTLKTEEVNELLDSVVKTLAKTFDAQRI